MKAMSMTQVPENDQDLVQRHQELEDAFRRLARRERYPGYWDYRNPRTAEEYLENNRKRRRNADRRMSVAIQRLVCGAALGLLWAFVLACLVGGVG